MEARPTPGSSAAIKLGCTCPVLDNARGFGYHGMKGVFVYTANCQVHSKEATDAVKLYGWEKDDER